MMSALTYKSLLFIMALSQFLLLLLFWRERCPLRDSDNLNAVSRRSSCNCEQETLNYDEESERFRLTVENKTQDDRIHFVAKARQAEQSKHSGDSRATSRNDEFTNIRPNTNSNDKDRPVLLVAIITARQYHDRRQAVRETWMQDCDSNRNVVCKFFTDAQDGRGDPIDIKILDQLKEESAQNRGDLVLLDSPSGTNFSLRLLALFEWAKKNLKFDYLLRIDDDHFLCLDRLITELPFRPRNRLYWGHLHCVAGIVRIDEGMMILSADLVDEFLQGKDGLLCHKYADQAVAMWIYRSMKTRPVTWFGDARVHHDPPASYLYEFRNRQEICHTFLSLHGTYPAEMRAFQKVIERERRNVGNDYAIPPIVDLCPYRRDHFDWDMLQGQYRAKPVPCKDEPIWLSQTTYQGRTSNHLHDAIKPPPKQVVRIHHVVRHFGAKSSVEAKINSNSLLQLSADSHKNTI